jgi:signal transduction histidine kinase
MNRLTIRWRVTLVAVVVLALALAALSVAGSLLLTNRLRADTDNVLRNRADAQTATIARVDGRVIVRDPAADRALDDQSWVFSDGKALERGRAAPDIQAAVNELSKTGTPAFKTIDERVRLYARPAVDDDGSRLGTVVVGVSTRPYERSEHIARLTMGLLSLFVLLSGAALLYWAVGRALRPVDTMTRRAADWSEHDLHRRFELGAPRDEITNLAATLDSLLARIDAAMQREQRVTAEIAHELRTPLASMRAEAELGLRGGDTDEHEALERIVAGADRLNGAIETLLAAHRGDTPEGRSCDPFDAAQTAVETFRQTHHDCDWSVSGREDESRVDVDQAVLVQTLGPLLENAARHAARGVDVAVDSDGSRVTIAVTDDGPGLSSDGGDIFAPGVSGSDRAGLGLPLAKRLAQSFGAEIVAVSAPGGGRFELRVPGRRPS